MSKQVYILWYVPEGSEEENDELLIGIYESHAAAQAAMERVQDKPGFSDYPKGFRIHCRELGQDNWTEGFIRD